MLKVKIRAAEDNRKLKDTIAELLEKGLEQPRSESQQIFNRVELPLIKGGRPAKPGEEITPERIHEILLEQDVERALGR